MAEERDKAMDGEQSKQKSKRVDSYGDEVVEVKDQEGFQYMLRKHVWPSGKVELSVQQIAGYYAVGSVTFASEDAWRNVNEAMGRLMEGEGGQ